MCVWTKFYTLVRKILVVINFWRKLKKLVSVFSTINTHEMYVFHNNNKEN